MKKSSLGLALSGAAAGAVNGIFGAAGGMVLVPMLGKWGDLPADGVFPASVSIILPISLVTLLTSSAAQPLPWAQAMPYLISSAVGGILAGIFGRRIPTLWLHRALGILILWGGIRFLC